MPDKKQNKKNRLARVANDPAFIRVKELRRRQQRRRATQNATAQEMANIQQELTQLESLSEGKKNDQ